MFAHLIIWTLIPSISNTNLPLDTIEALAWGSNLDWGFSKHPPLSAFFVEIFYQIFGNKDWVYYLLSQIFVVFTFFIVTKFSEDFFENKIYCLISIFLLEGIYFYNFTTPEFNVNVCQLPFWALTVYFCWQGVNKNDHNSWLLFGVFAALGFLSKYLFVYLLVSIDIFLIYLIVKKKFNFKCLISLLTFFLILSPHLIWLVENDYVTLTYAISRTGMEEKNFLNHLTNPIIFLAKQIGILLPFFIIFLFSISKFKKKITLNLKSKKMIFLIIINITPLLLMFFTSLFFGVKIRTMWMTPFYLFSGVLLVYIFQEKINLNKLKYFFIMFLIIFIFSPFSYYYISITQNDKRTDYPGKKIAHIVQKKWKNNFSNEIGLIGGDEWNGGNLSYHLTSRPKWDNILESKTVNLKNPVDGFVIIGNPNVLSEICNGLFFKIENQGICMVGKKK